MNVLGQAVTLALASVGYGLYSKRKDNNLDRPFFDHHSRFFFIFTILWLTSGLFYSSFANAAHIFSDDRCGTRIVVEESISPGGFTFFLPGFPSNYSNPTSDDAELTTWLLPNRVFPGSQENPRTFLGELNTPPGPVSGTNGSLGLLLPLDTDFGTVDFRFVVEVRKVSGGSVIDSEECTVQVIIGPRGILESLIEVPVRMCVIEGSPSAENQPPGSTVPADKPFSLLQMASELLLRDAQIIYWAASAPHGIPVISDPSPPVDGNVDAGQLGDIGLSDHPLDFASARDECEIAWSDKYPNQQGLIVLYARRFIDERTEGQALGPPLALYTQRDSDFRTGVRGDDLCGHPRNLFADDVTSQYILMPEVSNLRRSEDQKATALAHEIGHTLLLGHGNGLDDDMNGLEPPELGTRRFDIVCDSAAEDISTGSLMKASINIGGRLQPLQIEQARAVSKIYPGASYSGNTARVIAGAGYSDNINPSTSLLQLNTCNDEACDSPAEISNAPVEISLTKMEMSVTPEKQVTGYSLTLETIIEPSTNASYMLFADLDKDAQTGCAPSGAEFPTSLTGVELVTKVVLTPGTLEPQVQAYAWRCKEGSLMEIPSSLLETFIVNHSEAESGEDLFGVITLRLPNSERGPAGEDVHLQAVAKQLVENGQEMRIPDDPAKAVLVKLVSPELSACVVSPRYVSPGGAINVYASGLAPSAMIDLILGGDTIYSSVTNSDGIADMDLFLPAVSNIGLRQIAVKVRSSTDSANCALIAVGDPLTPATIAITSPTPITTDWNNENVTVTLEATPIPNGAAIKEIEYSTSGAQPSTPVISSGKMASVFIMTEGTTSVTFFATDEDNTVEPAQKVTVMLDKTDPEISGSASPMPNSFGWVNTDVTVEFICTDDRSGIFFCTGLIPVNTEGSNQTADGLAQDLSGNETETSVGGIYIDKTSPIVTYTGNTSPYSIIETIDIQCDANDALSGIYTTTCANVTGSAYDFAPGTNTFSSQAIDKADNLGNGSTSFEVLVTFDDLCALTLQFIAESNTNPKKANFLGNSLCSKLEGAETFDLKGKTKQKTQKIKDYLRQLDSTTKRFFTKEQALILKTWANAL